MLKLMHLALENLDTWGSATKRPFIKPRTSAYRFISIEHCTLLRQRQGSLLLASSMSDPVFHTENISIN